MRGVPFPVFLIGSVENASSFRLMKLKKVEGHVTKGSLVLMLGFERHMVGLIKMSGKQPNQGETAQHRGSVHAFHPAILGLNLGVPKFILMLLRFIDNGAA